MKSIATITCFSSKINNFKNICFFYFWNIGGAAESVNFAAPPIFQRLGHLLLLHLFVDDVPGGQLVPDLLQADAQLEHEDHHMVGQVGDLVDGLLLVLGLAGDDDFGGLLPHLFEDLVDALLKEVGGVGPLLGALLPALEHVHEALEGEGGVLLALKQRVMEAGLGAGVAGGPLLVHPDHQGIVVAVGGDVDDVLHRPGGLPLPPQLLAGAAPEAGALLLDGDVQALLVHVGQGKHLAGGPIHHDGGDEALLVKLQLFHGLLVQHGFSPSQSSAHGDAVVPQGLFQVGDGNLPKVEHRGRQPRVHPGQGLEEVHKVLDLPRAPGGDHRDLHRLAHGGQHLQVKAPFDPVGVDGVDHHLPGAQVHAVFDPADGLHPRVVPASPGEDPELALHPLHVGGEDHALAAVPQGGLADQVGVADGPGVHAHLIRPALEDPVKVLQGVDAAPHGEGDEHPAGGLAEDVGEQPPALGGGGDVVKHQLVGPALGVVLRQFDGGVHVVEAFKVDPLHHPAVLHVQAGDDPPS